MDRSNQKTAPPHCVRVVIHPAQGAGHCFPTSTCIPWMGRTETPQAIARRVSLERRNAHALVRVETVVTRETLAFFYDGEDLSAFTLRTRPATVASGC